MLPVNLPVLKQLNPEQVEVEILLAPLDEKPYSLESELDEMWSYVAKKSNPQWLWYAIDHCSGRVLAYVFGTRKDQVFLQLKALLELFGITRFYTLRLESIQSTSRTKETCSGETEHPKNRKQEFEFTDKE